MFEYLYPIKQAVIIFPFVAALITIPFIVYQYRKYNYYNKFRAFILYTFILFLMCAYFLIILPFPKIRDVASLQLPGTKHYQIVPFNFVFDIMKDNHINSSNPLAYLKILKQRSFLQVAFNAILLLPLGVYLRYYFKKSLKSTLIITFLLSLFFEITQLTAVFGYFNAPYRLFDVDDLILNTLSGYIGYVIAPSITFFLPDSEKIDENVDLKSMNVGLIRRVLAFTIDYNIVIFIVFLISAVARLIGILEPYKIEILKDIMIVLIGFIYFIIYSYRNKGRTLGKKLVKIRLKGSKDQITKKELVVRYITLYLMLYGINRILYYISTSLDNTNGITISTIVSLISGIYVFILYIYLIIKSLSKETLYFHDKVSKTKNVVDI